MTIGRGPGSVNEVPVPHSDTDGAGPDANEGGPEPTLDQRDSNSQVIRMVRDPGQPMVAELVDESTVNVLIGACDVAASQAVIASDPGTVK